MIAFSRIFRPKFGKILASRKDLILERAFGGRFDVFLKPCSRGASRGFTRGRLDDGGFFVGESVTKSPPTVSILFSREKQKN
jgi:hypothetical protein